MYLNNLRGKYENDTPLDKKTRDHVNNIFDETDKNGDNQLSMDEILELARKIDSKVTSDDLRRIKYYLDADDDLHLDRNEFPPLIDLIIKNKAAREAASGQ
ncbi:hypothetical protein BGZ74_010352 [Mortierella antarctica]|nr:hypothetical protein BGZ74_010352 [Mortierella antarctica]